MFITGWHRWDAVCYERIANGYASYKVDGDFLELVFFPLYPWLMKIVNFLIPHLTISGLVTSIICTSFASVFMYKLVTLDYNKSTAEKAVVLMNIFPFAFFYNGVMSEGLFLLTSIASLYYIRKHKWYAAGLFGFLCALTRSLGVFIIIPATVEFIEEYNIFGNFKEVKRNLLLILKKWCWLLLIPMGMVIYLYINYHFTNDAFYFLKMEEKYWFQVSQPFYKTVGDLWLIITQKRAVSIEFSAFIPGLIILLCTYVTMLYGTKNHKSFLLTWMWVSLLVNTSMSWPLSLCRYLTTIVPAYIILADIGDKNEKVYNAMKICFLILFAIYLVGHVTNKQIM